MSLQRIPVFGKITVSPVSVVKKKKNCLTPCARFPRTGSPGRQDCNALPDVPNIEDSSKAPGVVLSLGLEFIPVMSKQGKKEQRRPMLLK